MAAPAVSGGWVPTGSLRWKRPAAWAFPGTPRAGQAPHLREFPGVHGGGIAPSRLPPAYPMRGSTSDKGPAPREFPSVPCGSHRAVEAAPACRVRATHLTRAPQGHYPGKPSCGASRTPAVVPSAPCEWHRAVEVDPGYPVRATRPGRCGLAPHRHSPEHLVWGEPRTYGVSDDGPAAPGLAGGMPPALLPAVTARPHRRRAGAGRPRPARRRRPPSASACCRWSRRFRCGGPCRAAGAAYRG